MGKQFDDAVTAFRNMQVLGQVGFTASDVVTYGAVYVAAMSATVRPRVAALAATVPAVEMALEDAALDLAKLTEESV